MRPEDAFLNPPANFAYLQKCEEGVSPQARLLSLGLFLQLNKGVEEIIMEGAPREGDVVVPQKRWSEGHEKYVGEYLVEWLEQHHQVWVESSTLAKVAKRMAVNAIEEKGLYWLRDE